MGGKESKPKDNEDIESLKTELKASKQEIARLKLELEGIKPGGGGENERIGGRRGIGGQGGGEDGEDDIVSIMEEYILTLNHSSVPHPRSLDYLLSKTTGDYEFPNGDRYKGELVGGVPNGEGEKTGVDGVTVRGRWVGGKKHGRMVTRVGKSEEYSEHSVDSFYCMGTRQGYSMSKYDNGEERAGSYMDDGKEGLHKISFRGGSYMISEYSNDVQHGWNFYFTPQERVIIVSRFENGSRSGEKVRYTAEQQEDKRTG